MVGVWGEEIEGRECEREREDVSSSSKSSPACHYSGICKLT